MSDKPSRFKVWYDHEVIREKIFIYLKTHPLSKSFEVAEAHGITQAQAYHHLRKLSDNGYATRVGTKIAAAYTATNREFVRKYPDGYVEEMEAITVQNKLDKGKKYRVGNGKDTSVIPDNTLSPVIKVNEYTTIYMNSRKPTAPPSNRNGVKKAESRGVGSGMSMFDSW
jgi:hypothetical protein